MVLLSGKKRVKTTVSLIILRSTRNLKKRKKKEMSSNPGQASSKPVNIPNQSVSATHHSAPSVDTGGQRRPGGSGSFGAGLSSRNSNSPRNNQSRKNQHRRQPRSRLLDDDEYSELVCPAPLTTPLSPGRRLGDWLCGLESFLTRY